MRGMSTEMCAGARGSKSNVDLIENERAARDGVGKKIELTCRAPACPIVAFLAERCYLVRARVSARVRARARD